MFYALVCWWLILKRASLILFISQIFIVSISQIFALESLRCSPSLLYVFAFAKFLSLPCTCHCSAPQSTSTIDHLRPFASNWTALFHQQAWILRSKPNSWPLQCSCIRLRHWCPSQPKWSQFVCGGTLAPTRHQWAPFRAFPDYHETSLSLPH